jgi:putative copper export protein
LTVRFSEPIKSDFIDVRFLSDGDTAPLVGALDPTDDRVLVVPLPPLGDGVHQISFAVRDREDLHEVRGRTSFAIGDTAQATPSPPPNAGPQPPETAARWCFAIGLALLVGVTVRAGRQSSDERDRRRRLLGWTALALVLAGRVGILLARALDLGVGLMDGLSAVVGTTDMVRLPLTLVAAACVVPTLRTEWLPVLDATVSDRSGRTFRNVVAWVGIVWLAVLASWGDHAALKGAVEPATALAKTAHFLGLGLWVGVLAVTLVCAWGSGRTMAELVSVSRVAVAGAVVAVSSGLLLAGRMIVSLTGLFSTHFGQLLVVKLSIAAVAVLLGLTHRRWRVLGVAAIEAVLLCCGTVLLGAAMATAGPATDSAYLPAPPVPVKSVVAEVDDVLVRMHAIPAIPGPNALDLVVLQTRRPIRAPLGPMEVRVVTTKGPRTWTVQPDGRGAAVVEGVDLAEGATDVEFTVTRDGIPDTVLHAQVVTAQPRYVHPEVVSSRAIEIWCRIAALLVGLLLIPVAVLPWWRSRRSKA